MITGIDPQNMGQTELPCRSLRRVYLLAQW